MTDATHTIDSIAALEARYGAVNPNSLRKELERIHPLYRPYIEASPFMALATCGPQGMDVTPRGDPAGFVQVEDEKTVLIPDRRGNNRLDSLRNLIADPRIALLFLVPGLGETLRVNGRATISIDPALLERFVVAGKPPQSVIRVAVEAVYFQCARALLRSKLWDPALHVKPGTLPSPGKILQALVEEGFDGAAYDRDAPARLAANLY